MQDVPTWGPNKPKKEKRPCFLIAPDAFKGTLSPLDAAQAMARGLREVDPEAEMILHPLADGGEGTLDVLLMHREGEWREAQVHDAKGRLRSVSYALFTDRDTTWAVIESARVIGYTLIDDVPRTPLDYGTRGLGELVSALLDLGIRHIIVTLGGSATTDAGLGFLSALGAKLWGADGVRLPGRAADLFALKRIDLFPLREKLSGCTLVAWTDVTAPFCGEEGAVYTFGPQKGLLSEDVKRLDKAFCDFLTLPGMPEESVAYAKEAGSGAAGGLGFALRLSGGTLRAGAAEVARWTGFYEKLRACDIVLTGEGKSDQQTLGGKLPYDVARFAKEAGKKVVLLSGQLGSGWEALRPYFDDIRAASEGRTVESREMAEDLLARATAAWARHAKGK